MLDSFCEQESSEAVRATLALELRLSLLLGPSGAIEVPNVGVQGLCEDRAGTNGPIAAVTPTPPGTNFFSAISCQIIIKLTG